MDTHDAGPSSVPVPAGDTGPRALSVLEALREYRVAEAAMQRRTRPTRDMNESDLLALRHLLDAEADGAQVRQKDLAVRLGMSSAAATSLVDRLVRSGHITREPDPADRRAVNLLPMPSARVVVREALGNIHPLLIRAAAELTQQEAETVKRFLTRMREAADAVAPPLRG
ncbi:MULTISPECIES: MarR family transcriptional regulator [unclassified Arthrobacter]|uniref:MarR family winged helix-turn-helix transcriptional regulator n=1 Tax=unclassified Arthrobacter TaxID=235627 RepID=UPI0034223FC3